MGSKPRKLRVLNRRKRASLEFLNCSVDRRLIREKPEGSLAKRPVKRYAGSNLACPLPIGWPGPTPRAGAAALSTAAQSGVRRRWPNSALRGSR